MVDLSPPRPARRVRTRVRKYRGGRLHDRLDHLATEEPMELRLQAGGEVQTLAITMRTPGDDFELAAGFLHGEGVVSSRAEIRRIAYCLDPDLDDDQRYNVVTVELAAPTLPDLAALERHFTTTSACGVCGKACLDSLAVRGVAEIGGDLRVAPATLAALPDALRRSQAVFDRTGGLHAAALFDRDGGLVGVREDVGRHNALDKLVGSALLEGRLPLGEAIVLVSGRASYELVQKAAAAGVAVLCAISAPSSLAVDVARRFGMTLVAFLRGERFNVYSGDDRIVC